MTLKQLYGKDDAVAVRLVIFDSERQLMGRSLHEVATIDDLRKKDYFKGDLMLEIFQKDEQVAKGQYDETGGS